MRVPIRGLYGVPIRAPFRVPLSGYKGFCIFGVSGFGVVGVLGLWVRAFGVYGFGVSRYRAPNLTYRPTFSGLITTTNLSLRAPCVPEPPTSSEKAT